MTRRDVFRWFKTPALIFLKLIKRVRRFDRTFEVYFPDLNDSRELLLWKLKVLNPLLNIDVHFRRTAVNAEPIDIYIPATLKDIDVLKDVLKNALLYIKHPINKIYLVCKPSAEFSELCAEYGATMVDERAVLNYSKAHINYIYNDEDRSGWLYQQLLKLNAGTIVETENFLVLDADTIFIKPKVFLYKNKTIFDVSEERHEPYHRVYEKILKRKSVSELSFISHYMLFNKSLLRQLKSEIEIIHGKPWDKVILEFTDYSSISGFSEYELYGNFVSEKYPSKIKKEYWFNTTSPLLSNYTKSMSKHSYL